MESWTPQEWRYFLNALPRALHRAQLDDLDETFALSRSTNAEVLFAWLRLAIESHYDPARLALEAFLTSQGRGKFLKPLYTQLMSSDWGRDLALSTYAHARPTYHATVTRALDPVLLATQNRS
jgi:leukotriene-A4 hydrolase